MSAPHPIPSRTVTTDLPPPVTAADVWIGGLTDRQTAESLIGDLVEERHERPRGWYGRQVVGAVARLLGRALRTRPLSVIGSMVMGGVAGMAAGFLVTLLILTGEFITANTGDVIPSLPSSAATTLITNVLLAIVTGPIIGAVAAAGHRRAPLAPVLVLALITLASPLLSELMIVLNPPLPGSVDPSRWITELARAPFAAAAIVAGGWWYARRRARRAATTELPGR